MTTFDYFGHSNANYFFLKYGIDRPEAGRSFGALKMLKGMFERIEEEIASVKTPRFHLVEGPLSQEQKELVENSNLQLPATYKAFVIRFGHAQLYRWKGRYLVEVFNPSKEFETRDGELLFNIGRGQDGLAYFRTSLLAADTESPVFTWTDDQLTKEANSFEEWLVGECNYARRRFKGKWREIIAGPAPFTDEEEAIVGARGQYQWRVVGIAKNGDLRFEVLNGSKMRLPCRPADGRNSARRVPSGGIPERDLVLNL